MTEKKEFNYKVSTIVLIIVTIAILIALVVFVVNYDNCVQCSEKNVSLEEPKDPYTGEILGPDKVEVGQNVHYDANLTHYNESVSNYLEWQIICMGEAKGFFKDKTLIPENPGIIVIKAIFNNEILFKKVEVVENASINLSMKSWIHPDNWYSLGISSASVKNLEVHLYQVTSTGRTIEVSFSNEGKWRLYDNKEIFIEETGNYLVEVKGKALSDNRTVSAQRELTVTSFVQRGYHEISWDNQNLVEFTPNDLVSAGIFLKEGILIEDTFINGKVVEVDHISSAYYYIYKDPSRGDTILYQTGVTTNVGKKKQMLYAKTVASDGTVWYLLWDDFIVVASKENPFFYRGMDTSSDSGSYSPSPAPVPAPVPAPIVIVSPSPPI